MFNVDKLKRNPDVIREVLLESKLNNFINTSDKNLYIVFPARYAQIGLLNYYEEYKEIYSLFMIVDEDNNYSIWSGASLTRIANAPLTTFSKDNMDYMVHSYAPDSIVLPSNKIIQNGLLLFNILQELIVYGKVPFYIDYDDINTLADYASEYAGSSIGDMTRIVELLSSIIAHDPKNTKQHYRHSDKTNRPVFYGLSQVQADTLSPFGKIMGNYANPALLSSIISDGDEEASKIEQILRYN